MATSRRSVKRKTAPPAAGGGGGCVDEAARLAAAEAELAELRRTVGEQEAAIRELRADLEAEKEAIEQLRRDKKEAEAEAVGLRADLEAERGAAETAASEAMLMIERLQREKAAALMEARQFRRYAEGHANHDRELQDELAAVSDLADSYRTRLVAHGIDPEATADDDLSTDANLDAGESGDMEKAAAAPETSGSSSSSSSAMEKDMFEESLPIRNRRLSGDSSASVSEEPKLEKEENFPVVMLCAANEADEAIDKEYTIDVGCATKAGAMEEYVGARGCGEGNELYIRLVALEADRNWMRREIAALRAEKAQLVLMREMARRLSREMVADKSIVKKASSQGTFSVVAIFKWVFSVISWRNNHSKARCAFGLSTTFVGLLLLLDRSTGLTPWIRFPRAHG